jgi:hypothetical protein
MVQASLDPSTPLRQAGQAIAYTALLAQEGLNDATGSASTDPSSPTPAGSAAPVATPSTPVADSASLAAVSPST